ncbi:hypothetical protein [Streptomyces sp. ISL-100]|uniref:hypothetical protein n=1 Tax=Streptomyces sp. ISL-100 TaxID=2819173 RepID=UPI001BEAE802|nr:hypothetical protein [Streptomyces sp. ISL-100]MBT2399490.1 hypothetical protein [Streptomyces sp. ISL-100]
MTKLPFASVSSLFSITGPPAAPAWSSVAVQVPDCYATLTPVQVSPPSYEYDSFTAVSAPGV